MTKLQLNKNNLRLLRAQLQLYREYLPVLELRKQRLLSAVRTVDKKARETEAQLQQLTERYVNWSGLLTRERPQVVLSSHEVKVGKGRIAGATVPVLEGVKLPDRRYSLLATSPLFDDAVALLRKAIETRGKARGASSAVRRPERRAAARSAADQPL